jgi:hypothetical protein
MSAHLHPAGDRWNKRLATVAPEFVGCRGFTLDEQLDPSWRPG